MTIAAFTYLQPVNFQARSFATAQGTNNAKGKLPTPVILTPEAPQGTIAHLPHIGPLPPTLKINHTPIIHGGPINPPPLIDTDGGPHGPINPPPLIYQGADGSQPQATTTPTPPAPVAVVTTGTNVAPNLPVIDPLPPTPIAVQVTGVSIAPNLPIIDPLPPTPVAVQVTGVTIAPNPPVSDPVASFPQGTIAVPTFTSSGTQIQPFNILV